MRTAPWYDERTVFGPFKRIMSGTQTADDMRSIITSGELWGREPAHGVHPAAQAHNGALNDAELGFEFYAVAPPDQPWGPPYWRVRADGSVRLENGVAKVKIFVSRVTMALV